MNLTLLFALGSLCLAALACEVSDSGQTGSASTAPPPEPTLSCVCQALSGRYLVKGTVTAVDGAIVTVLIDEVRNPNAAFNDADVGRVFSARIWAPLTCDFQPMTTPANGDQVWALISLSSYATTACSNYGDCYATYCEAPGQGSCELGYLRAQECAENCSEACIPNRDSEEFAADAWILPGTDTIDMGEGIVLSPEHATRLADPIACYEDHPPRFEHDCSAWYADDTDDTGTAEGCSVAGGPGSGRPSWCWALAFGAALSRLRRLRKFGQGPVSADSMDR